MPLFGGVGALEKGFAFWVAGQASLAVARDRHASLPKSLRLAEVTRRGRYTPAAWNCPE